MFVHQAHQVYLTSLSYVSLGTSSRSSRSRYYNRPQATKVDG